jgi:hypothetical protein
MAVQVRDFLKARRDRALGTILGYGEREVWSALTHEQQRAFRGVIVQALNDYHDSVLDLVKSDTGEVRNEEIMELLERIDQTMSRRPARL